MNTENVATWRDIADQLNDKQRAELEHWERHPELPPRADGADPTMFADFADNRRKSMLNMAREYAARNVAAIRCSDVPGRQRYLMPPTNSTNSVRRNGFGGAPRRSLNGVGAFCW